MIKFEVRKDKEVEVVTHNRNWTVNDIIRDYDNKSDHYPELLKSFDTEEDARAFFESEKQYCSTTWWKGCGSSEGIHYDVLTLDKVEYDEDGEYIQGDMFEMYVVAYDG